VPDIAAALGYSKPEQLTAQIRYLAGLNVRDLREGDISADIIANVRARLTAPCAGVRPKSYLSPAEKHIS